MGPENKIDFSGCTLYLDGEPMEQIGTLPEITLNENAQALKITLGKTQTITMEIKMPKRWRCRSRKRFIKLMMSEGINRNYAEWLADFVRELMPYGEAWRQYFLLNFWIIKIG